MTFIQTLGNVAASKMFDLYHQIQRNRMIHNTTISNVAAPELFRHTPFEHETTTDAWSLFTTIQPLVVTMLPQEHAGVKLY